MYWPKLLPARTLRLYVLLGIGLIGAALVASVYFHVTQTMKEAPVQEDTQTSAALPDNTPGSTPPDESTSQEATSTATDASAPLTRAQEEAAQTVITPAPKQVLPKEAEPVLLEAKPMHDAYSPFKNAMTSVFWVGETPDEDNGYISNVPSAWDERWQEHFGGVDDPTRRCGYLPCAFVPKENPFYVALPYFEFTDNGSLKTSAHAIPWYEKARAAGEHLLKNRWVEVRRGDKTCYGQWQDVGPFSTDDFAYVFGDAQTPENTRGLGAGLDVSPALATCLALNGSGETQWRFVPASSVPQGPWTQTITTR